MSHVSDVVGPVSLGLEDLNVSFSDVIHPFQEGLVYAVEFSHRSGRDLINMVRFVICTNASSVLIFTSFQAKKRTNVIPIIEDARHPHKYRMLVGMVDVIFADVAQPNQVC